jgi:predicted ATPase
LIGERFEPQLVSDALELDRLASLESLDNVARETRILREEIGESGVARFFFDHSKIREVVIKELSSSLKIELHRRIALVLVNAFQQARLEEAVFHYRAAGAYEKVLELAPLCGDRARARFAYTESILYYNWALEAVEKIHSVDEKANAFCLLALIGRAESWAALGRSERALRDAQKVLDRKSSSSERIRAIRICAESSFEMGHSTESLKFCEMKETQEKQEGKESVLEILRIKNIRAKVTGYRGNPQAAISELEQITERLRSLGERKQYALVLLDRR